LLCDYIHRLVSLLDCLAFYRTLLRAHLHFEVARCELSADFLAKAAEQLHDGLALDYGTTAKEPAEVLAGSALVLLS
jgi:hypothetical protein